MRLRASLSVKLLAPGTGGTAADGESGTGVADGATTAGGVGGAGAGALVWASAALMGTRVRANKLGRKVFMVVPIASSDFASRLSLERAVSMKVALRHAEPVPVPPGLAWAPSLRGTPTMSDDRSKQQPRPQQTSI